MKNFKKIIKEHIEYKEQVFKLAKTDVIKTYRGAALGWAWAIIKPAVTIFVYWFAFTIGLRAGKDINGFPFFLWLISGIIPWFYMNDMFLKGTESIRKYSYLVTKMKFPISIIPTFVSFSNLLIHIILVLLVIVIFILMGYYPTIYCIQLPIYILLNFLFFTVFTLFSSLLAAISKDFLNLVKSFVTAIFWLSGILWNVNTIDIPYLKKVLMLNPITFLVEGYRNCFINQVWFFEEPKRLMYFAIIFIVMIGVALWAYNKLRKEIPDVL